MIFTSGTSRFKIDISSGRCMRARNCVRILRQYPMNLNKIHRWARGAKTSSKLLCGLEKITSIFGWYWEPNLPHLSRETLNSSMKPKNIFDKDVNLDSMYYLRKTVEILKIKNCSVWFCTDSDPQELTVDNPDVRQIKEKLTHFCMCIWPAAYSSRNESYRYLCNHRRAYKGGPTIHPHSTITRH